MAKSVMVTGGAGMIGSNLVKRLVREGWDVYVADNLWRGKKEYLNDENGVPVIDMDTHFLLKDLADYDQCQECIGFTDYVVHLADIVAGIDYVFANQGELFRVNNLINSNLFASVRKNADKIKGLIYVGTVCSFPLTDLAIDADLRTDSAFGRNYGQLAGTIRRGAQRRRLAEIAAGNEIVRDLADKIIGDALCGVEVFRFA